MIGTNYVLFMWTKTIFECSTEVLSQITNVSYTIKPMCATLFQVYSKPTQAPYCDTRHQVIKLYADSTSIH